MRSSDRLRRNGSGSERISWFVPRIAFADRISIAPPSQFEETAEAPQEQHALSRPGQIDRLDLDEVGRHLGME